jgi:hypothetical protein
MCRRDKALLLYRQEVADCEAKLARFQEARTKPTAASTAAAGGTASAVATPDGASDYYTGAAATAASGYDSDEASTAVPAHSSAVSTPDTARPGNPTAAATAAGASASSQRLRSAAPLRRDSARPVSTGSSVTIAELLRRPDRGSSNSISSSCSPVRKQRHGLDLSTPLQQQLLHHFGGDITGTTTPTAAATAAAAAAASADAAAADGATAATEAELKVDWYEATLGCLRCLDALGDYSELSAGALKLWSKLKDDSAEALQQQQQQQHTVNATASSSSPYHPYLQDSSGMYEGSSDGEGSVKGGNTLGGMPTATATMTRADLSMTSLCSMASSGWGWRQGVGRLRQTQPRGREPRAPKWDEVRT